MKPRPPYFLSEENIDYDSEIFDYIQELHDYLWAFVRTQIPGASGDLRDYVDKALKIAEQRKRTDKKVFRTMAAIEKEFFPNTYKKKLEEEEKKKPGAFGTGLAKEIMEEIRRRLREESKNE